MDLAKPGDFSNIQKDWISEAPITGLPKLGEPPSDIERHWTETVTVFDTHEKFIISTDDNFIKE